MTAEPPQELDPGLWTWARTHPEWHPGDFGAEVIGFAADAGEATLLIDPLLAGDDDPAWELIEAEAARTGRAAVLITLPYHVRSAEEIRDRLDAKVTIHGHRACTKRMESTRGFSEIVIGEELPGGATAHRIGKPRRFETPIHLPSHAALVFGDAVVGVENGLRVWSMEPVDDKQRRFYAERFNPTLEPLLELDLERVLPTHGPPILSGGREALAEALTAPPWYHRP